MRISNVIDAMVYTRSPKTFKILMAQRVRWFLGFIDCLILHRQLFGRKYGYLGMFVLPSAVISITLSLTLFIYTFTKLAIDLVRYITTSSVASSYEVYKFAISSFKFDSFFYSITLVGFVTIVLFTSGLIVFHLARVYSKDSEKFALSYFVYLVLYVFVFASWWIKTLLVKFAGKNISFGGVVWNNSVIHNLRNRVS